MINAPPLCTSGPHMVATLVDAEGGLLFFVIFSPTWIYLGFSAPLDPITLCIYIRSLHLGHKLGFPVLAVQNSQSCKNCKIYFGTEEHDSTVGWE